jgi:hypothetical protein
MLDVTEFASDLAEIIADLPVACVFGGRAFNAASTDVGMNRAVEIDGVLFEIDRTIICSAAEVAATIAPPELITVGGTRYRVLKVSKHQDGVGLEIDLKTDTQ